LPHPLTAWRLKRHGTVARPYNQKRIDREGDAMSGGRTPATGERAEFIDSGAQRGRRRWVAVTAVGVVVLAAGAGVVWLAGGFGTHGSSGSGNASGLYGTSTATVRRETLSSQTTVSATLGYAGSYTVTVPGSPGSGSGSGSGPGSGTFTWMPAPGTVIREGQVAYRTDNGVPTCLLYGTVPAWRALEEGMHGADVAQLNHDLVRLGYADSGDIAALGWKYFSWDTRYGLEQLQGSLGLTETGTLPLGQAVFEPAALRVTRGLASLGSAASGPVFTATSDRHVVTISLDASQQSEVKKGDTVSVTLPDGTTTPGVVSSVGRVAVTSRSAAGATATIPVQVKLTHPGAAGRLDQAPVTVEITTSQARNALAVPVAALVARPGGYAVEVVSGHAHHLVPVTVGQVFDDAAGLVQVTGNLSPGERVVVPGT
jgi:hypothetical protein